MTWLFFTNKRDEAKIRQFIFMCAFYFINSHAAQAHSLKTLGQMYSKDGAIMLRKEIQGPSTTQNKLKEHDFSMKSIMYFTSSVVIDDKSKRPETNWWGVFNKKLITNCSVEPTKEQTKEAFSKLFKKPSRRHRSGQHNLLRRVLGDARIPDFVKNYARRGNYLPLIAYSKSNVPIWPQFNKDSE